MPDFDGQTFNCAYGGSSDWAKETLDFLTVDGSRRVETVEELRASLEATGETVEHFKTQDAYKLPLNSGNYPWLADL